MSNPALAKSISVLGLNTNYHDHGEGQVVVLLHGSAPGVSAYSNWRAAMPVLAKRWRVIAPDIPGFGYTERSPGAVYEMKSWVKHLLAFMDALNVRKAALVGNSFGGGLALATTLAAPDRVCALVLMGSGGVSFSATEGLMASWSYTPSEKNMRDLLTRFVYDPALLTDELVSSRYAASTEPGALDVFTQLMPPERRAPGAQVPGIPPEALMTIDKETLIIHGREDNVVPLENSLTLNRLISKSQLHVFGRCGHWAQAEQRERFHNLVEDFLAEQLAT
ncbi:MAG: alpha/beta hydrolase [Hyphomonadaceae bacterium]|nr:alpha/beta hydrolase [Hyphomonadaceae bacterium]